MWSLDVLSLAGANVQVGAPFGSARCTWALDGTGALEVDLRASDVAGGDWLCGQRRVKLKDYAGTAQFQGWLDQVSRTGAPGAVTYSASARGLGAILESYFVHGDFAKVSTVSTTIGWNLIQHAQAQTDVKLSATLGTVVGTAPSRTRYYCDGDNIKEAIDELADLGNGFDWEIDASERFNAWVGGRGSDLSGSRTLRPEDVNSWECTEDATGLATYGTGIGQKEEDQPCGPPLVVDSVALKSTYGRREIRVDGDEAQTETEMEEKLTDEMRAYNAARLNLRTTWIEGRGPWAFGDVWLGDIVNAQLGVEFGGDAHVKCTAVTVTLEPGVYEFIETEWQAA